MTAKSELNPESGAVLFIPLNRLKKSPKNARKMPHTQAEIEALAASIAAKGLLQNLVVEPERDGKGREGKGREGKGREGKGREGKGREGKGRDTGNFLVTIGEGRRLAQLLRVRRKEIRKTEPIRCVLDIEHDALEISLAENVIRTNMHPADQFEAFRQLAEERNMSAEDIAARFGVTPQVVRQRLRLGAISPKLMQVYRDGELSLEQLSAFAITDDHVRQEEVFERLSYNKDASIIRRMLTENHVPGRDRRARFVGAEAYGEAGGVIVRDLFADDYGGYFEDAALLDRLAMQKLQAIADQILAEGWKWTEPHIDFPHAHGMRRIYPHPVPLSPDDQERLDAVQAEFAALTAQHEDADELPDEIDAKFGELEAEIERLSEKQQAYDADDIARSGVFVVLNHDGGVRIERGFVRPEDEKPAEPDTAEGEKPAAQDDKGRATEPSGSTPDTDDDGAEGTKALSDLLVRDLTAHRTLGLRVALGETPDVALIAVTHTLAAQTFYDGHDLGTCLGIKSERPALAGHAEGIEDTPAARKLADRHASWARQLPQNVADLWGFIVALDVDSRMALFAHCAALTVSAVRVPWDRTPRAWGNADALAEAVGLDMAAFWRPTVRSYFGRVSKARILEAVREAESEHAAEQLTTMKKQPMAEAAEQLLIRTGWLPALLRTGRPTLDPARAVSPLQEACQVAAE